MSRLRELELTHFGLTVEQYIILNLLSNHGGSATSKTIEELTMRQHHSISNLINRMIKTKCVTKQKSTNGKGFEITITKDGKELHKKVPKTSIETVFSVLNNEEKKLLAHLLDLILEKSRNFLGLSYIPPFKQYFSNTDKWNTKSAKAQPDEILTDYGLWTKLIHTSFAVYRLRELELAQFDLTPEQYAILSLLMQEGGLATTKKIEDLTMRQHHSISTLISRMIRTGYVAKQKNVVLRGFDITITKEGKDLHKIVPAVSFEIAFSALNTEERSQMAHLLILIIIKARESLGLVPIS